MNTDLKTRKREDEHRSRSTVIRSLWKHGTRNTHALAKELGKPVNHTTALLFGFMKRGVIQKAASGRRGRKGYPPVWMLPPHYYDNSPSV